MKIDYLDHNNLPSRGTADRAAQSIDSGAVVRY